MRRRKTAAEASTSASGTVTQDKSANQIAARRARLYRERLDQDNYQEDPNPDGEGSKTKVLELPGKRKKKSKHSPAYYKAKYTRSFYKVVEDDLRDAAEEGRVSYMDVAAPKDKYPPFHACIICGFEGIYKCVKCHSRYCSTACFTAHADIRCT